MKLMIKNLDLLRGMFIGAYEALEPKTSKIHIMVAVQHSGYVGDTGNGEFQTWNISRSACRTLSFDDKAVTFNVNFGGSDHYVHVPYEAIVGLFNPNDEDEFLAVGMNAVVQAIKQEQEPPKLNEEQPIKPKRRAFKPRIVS